MVGRSPRASEAARQKKLLCRWVAVIAIVVFNSMSHSFVPMPMMKRVSSHDATQVHDAFRGVPAAAAVAATSSLVALRRGTSPMIAALAMGALTAGTIISARQKTMAYAEKLCHVSPDGSDPSLTMMTNVKLDGKKELMLALSKAVASCLGKPESYVAICVKDGEDIIWGGTDDPCALCTLYSLGAINLENNKALSAEVASLMEKHGVPANRIYINFFDVPRENCGYNGATFAG